MSTSYRFWFVVAVCLAVSGLAAAGTAEIAAVQGKAADARTPNEVIGETRLATRSATWPDAKKSWLQFDLSDLYFKNPGLRGHITNAKLVFYGAKSETGAKTYAVSGLNDSANLENWTAAALTWNNAPANDTVSPTALAAGLTTALYTGTVDVPCLDVKSETPEAARAALTDFLNTDTDGKITFILTAGGTSYLWNVGEALEPKLVIEGAIAQSYECEGVGIPFSAYAAVSCRVEGATYANTNRTDSSKLSVRASSNGVKSWIKFDLRELGIDPNNLKSATLRVALHAGKGGSQTCEVSAVNDNYRTNINWGETDITWNNAPGNDTSSLGLLNPAQTTLMGTIAFTDGLAGQQFFIDVLPALQADTDGIVQFVLHNSPNLLDFATHDHPSGAEYWPRLDILQAPYGADKPYPCPGQVVPSTLAGLSWANPDVNDINPQICPTVYLGTEPNRLKMDSVLLPVNAESVLINTANFPRFGSLVNKQTYYWIVDCRNEKTGKVIPGLVWSFYVNNNEAPVVEAGNPQVLWGLPKAVALDGSVTDDGLPSSSYTVLWTQVDNGAPAAVISPADAEDTTVTITQRGDYLFKLTADDGEAQGSDTVRVVVGETPCDASHLSSGAAYAPGDVNKDCIVNLEDFALLIAPNWMDCTDELTLCQ